MKKALLFKTGKKPYDQSLIQAFNSSDEIGFELNHYENLEILIKKDSINLQVNGVDIEAFDFVYFKSWTKKAGLAASIAHILAYKNIPFFDQEVLHTRGGKLLQMLILSANDLSVPKTLFCSSNKSYKEVEKLFGGSFIVKANSAREGELNFLIQNDHEYQLALKELGDKLFVIQEFIPNDFDYRVGVFGDQIAYIKKRMRTSSKTHLNNISQGATVEYINIDESSELVTMSLAAAKLFSRQVAGVDVIENSKTGQLSILEVNPAPAFKNDVRVIEQLKEVILKKIDNGKA